jgi:hypothetical protein
MSSRPDFSSKSDRDLLVELLTSFYDFKEHLAGNGNPGLCFQRGEELTAIRLRIASLESFKSWVNGAMAALGTVLTVALVAIGWLFQRGK